eukprot:7330418-Alexandrium_andersonii.AAC.1
MDHGRAGAGAATACASDGGFSPCSRFPCPRDWADGRPTSTIRVGSVVPPGWGAGLRGIASRLADSRPAGLSGPHCGAHS